MISLGDATRLLGCSERQLRYAIKQGRVEATKADGRWRIDSDRLPLTDGQRRARERKAGALRDAVEHALGPQIETAGYSVRSLGAFGAATRLTRTCGAKLGADHPASVALVAP